MGAVSKTDEFDTVGAVVFTTDPLPEFLMNGKETVTQTIFLIDSSQVLADNVQLCLIYNNFRPC